MQNDKELIKKALLEIRHLKEQLKDSNRSGPVAVIGMACRFPGGVRNTDDYWKLLESGKCGICEIPEKRWNEYGKEELLKDPRLKYGGFLKEDIREFDNRLFRILPDEAAYLDPQQRILLEVCWEAFENAGYSVDMLKNKRVGVFVGAVQNDFGYENMLRIEENMNITGMSHSFLSGRISYFFGLRGPSLSIDTACSSSAVAIDTAVKYLKDNACDMALVCGVNIMFSPEITKKIAGLGILSESGIIRAFDKNADGTVRGEGVGAVLLKNLSDAEHDRDTIHSLIIGSDVNQDGESTSLTAPNGTAQEELLSHAWKKSGIESADIGYIETHGTGTSVGDPIEINAIAHQLSATRTRPLYIGSVKTNLGHLEGSAGIAGVIKVSLMLEHKKIPASLHFDTPSAYVDWSGIPLKVADCLTDWETDDGKPRIACVSSFGLSGTNSHIVMQEYSCEQQKGRAMEIYPFVIASTDCKGIERQASALKDFLEQNPDCNLTDLSYSYNITRYCAPERSLVFGKDHHELINALSSKIPSEHISRQKKTVFVFTGQGSQYQGMCEGYYQENDTFRRNFDRCAELFAPYLQADLRDIIFSDKFDLQQTCYTQPAIFAVQYALVQMIRESGITPDEVIGHSIGEYAAACTAGVFSLEDAVKLVSARGRIIQDNSPEGRMLAVSAERQKTEKIITSIEDIYISASNSPMQTVVAGSIEAIEKAEKLCKENQIHTVMLRTTRPFHTPFMQQASEKFSRICETVTFRKPYVRMLSSVTANYENDAVAQASYWAKQILSEVRFNESIQAVGSLEEAVFLEIGSLPILSGLISAVADGAADCFCIGKKNADMAHVILTISSLFASGASVDLNKIYTGYVPRKDRIPNYCFAPNVIPYIHTFRNEDCTETTIVRTVNETVPENKQAEISPKNVRELLAELIGIDANELDENAELVSIGLDSISAVNVLRKINMTFGIHMTLSEMFRARTTKGLIKAVFEKDPNVLEKETIISEKLTINEAERYESFPLNEVQYAYWAGRDNPRALLSGSACCAYFEADVDDLDEVRFIEAVRIMEERHDMLRCRITDDAVQYIAKEIDPNVTVYDMTDKDVSCLDEIRKEMSHKILPLNAPLYEIRLSRLGGGKYRIHFLIDFMIADAMSLFIFKNELNRIYRGEVLEPLNVTYRDYELYCQNSKTIIEKAAEDEAFWLAKAEHFPDAPQLPFDRSKFADNSHREFVRRRMNMTRQEWKSFSDNAAKYGLTPSSALFALYSEVLSAYGGGSSFAVMLTVFRRHDVGPDTEKMIGDFTKLALVEVNRRQVSIAENAEILQQTMLENISHCEYSALKFTDVLRKKSGEDKLYPVIFTSAVGLEEDDQNDTDIMSKMRSIVSSTPQVCLDHQVFFENGTLVLSWDSLDEAFRKGVPDAMFEVYCTLVRSAASDGSFFETVLCDLRPEYQKAEHDSANATEYSYPKKLLHSGFIENAKRHPEKTALICDGRTYTYRELDRYADRVAETLLNAGASVHDRILVDLPKSFEQIGVVFGILKAGCIYVPLTYGQPASRTERVAEKAKPFCIISDKVSECTSVRQILLSDIPKTWNREILVPTDPEDGAYIIYTSGSTGQPKGVYITHCSAMNTIQDVNRRYKIGEDDRAFAVSSLSFDLSVYDIFGMLSVGGAIVMPTEEQRIDPKIQYQLVTEYNVTIWNSVPTIMDIFADHLLKRDLTCSIRKVILSGDWIPMELPEKLKKVLPFSTLTSMGGATEASIWSNYFDVTDSLEGWTSVPYGYPLANQKFYILDEFGRRCPDNTTGKLYIAGDGLAKGYYNEPELTDSAFRFHNSVGKRLYDTGDHGCYHSGGCIEFLGRTDGQVKINGYRVETAEIESAVRKCGITERVAAVPVGRKTKRLAVFIETEKSPDSAMIIKQLSKYLPHYFIPEAVVNITKFPLTANGKFDRKKLAEIYENTRVVSVNSKENTGSRSAVLNTIAEILGISQIDPDDSFGRLGVSSVDMIRLADELEHTYGIRPSVSKMLSYHAISELAEFFDSAEQKIEKQETRSGIRREVIRTNVESQTVEISPLEKYQKRGITLYAENGALRFRAEKGAMTEEIRLELKQEKACILEYLEEQENKKRAMTEYISKNAYPLTPIQKAYLLGRSEDYELGGTSAHYYTELVWEDADVQKLENAVNSLIDSHDMLRTVVLEDGRQMMLESVPYYKIQYRNISEKELRTIRGDWKEKIYEVGKWPMFDVFVSKLPDGRSIVHFSFDCMLLDGWSANMMIHQIYELYQGKTIDVPEYTFCEYVTNKDEWQKNKDYVRNAEEYWEHHAEELPTAPSLPYKLNFSEVTKPHFSRLRYELSEKQTLCLNEHLRKYSATASAVICTAYMRVLSICGGSEDFSLNLTVYNRLPLNREVKKLLGDFTNVTAVAYHRDSQGSFLREMNAVREELIQAVEHRTYNGLDILKKLSGGDPFKAVLPVVFTSELFGSLDEEDTSELFRKTKELYAVSQTPQVSLDHQALVRNGRLVLIWDYVTELFTDEIINEMFSRYTQLVENLADAESWEEM
ncbi:MAG: amino acid adenylation domain-containing protein [Ruminococcus sp.]|uniref:non-ribosomal peptide synthetase/type I polyketide synthase n=1 Tax=Ruminococcus sp. TaxID=41978 RepID=UPI0025F29FBF|nr:non-ribosomal peptide synthetase/type I polyketide synthase [Ruminococcus sp.]MCR5540499.1 amino acid adenylation domain-containing protein [Ruminococcus sp.]